MTRGNQRDLARAKSAKKQVEEQKKKSAADKDGNKGLTLEQRKQRDADALRQKQAMKASASGPAGSSS